MKKYSYILSLSDELISAVNARDALTMQQKIEEQEKLHIRSALAVGWIALRLFMPL